MAYLLLICSVALLSHYNALLCSGTSRRVTLRQMHTMLQQRIEGHPEETSMWYTNYEGVALRRRDWLQRHIGCR